MPPESFFLNKITVQRIMQLQGYGRNSLAKAMAKDPSEISLWINGKRRITLANANDFAKILGCTVRQLKGEEPFTKLDLIGKNPSIGTAQRYIEAIRGQWLATSTFPIAADHLGQGTFEWQVDIAFNNNILTGETVCVTPDYEQAHYILQLEVNGLGIVLIDGVRDAADGATDIFRGILQYHSDTRTSTMNGLAVTYWPVLNQICPCEIRMQKITT